MPQDDNDRLDGLCDPEFDHGPEVTDDLTPWVVLFASCLDENLQVWDRDRLAVKAAEWRVLLGEPFS